MLIIRVAQFTRAATRHPADGVGRERLEGSNEVNAEAERREQKVERVQITSDS